jgi:hypothetical protein
MRIPVFATAWMTAGVAALMVWGGGKGLGSPANRGEGKPAVFPAGPYVLTGGREAARGDDVLELRSDFKLRRNQYVLSGGPKPTDTILVDDDLEVKSGDRKVFEDDDGVRTTETRGKQPAKYQGHPIVLVLDPKEKLRIRVTDHSAVDAIVGELWLHRHDGGKRRLTKEIREASADRLPHMFFDEQFDLGQGFERPEREAIEAGTVEQLPERPATLLPRFRGVE